MSALLALVLAAGPYDADPNHLWNRIHAAIHGWSVERAEGNPSPDRDSLHWPADVDHLDGASQRSLIPLLREFLRNKGEDLVPKPLQRAVLQRDLWMIFEWSLDAEREADADKATHRDLRKGIVEVMRRIALTADQIGKLPETYGDAAKADPKLLPGDLLDPKGPWVTLANAAGGPLALRHTEFFHGRAAFLILLSLPGGRAATEAYVRRIGEIPMGKIGDEDQCPDGTRVALIRRSFLIDDRGLMLPSTLTESVQLRLLHKGGEPESIKFRLNRAALFSGKGGGLVSDEKDWTRTLLLGNHKVDAQVPVLKSCVQCHVSSSITSLEVVFSIRRKARAILTPSTWDEELWICRNWSWERFSYGQLRALWPD